MKYIVITSKHHDGFAMFRSSASSYNIWDATPFKRDPLKELGGACRRHGIRLGFYYSQAQDWRQPGGSAHGGHWDSAQDGNMDDYIREVAVPQVRGGVHIKLPQTAADPIATVIALEIEGEPHQTQ